GLLRSHIWLFPPREASIPRPATPAEPPAQPLRPAVAVEFLAAPVAARLPAARRPVRLARPLPPGADRAALALPHPVMPVPRADQRVRDPVQDCVTDFRRRIALDEVDGELDCPPLVIAQPGGFLAAVEGKGPAAKSVLGHQLQRHCPRLCGAQRGRAD